MDQTELFTLPIRYRTLPASSNRIDAVDLGQSDPGHTWYLSTFLAHDLDFAVRCI